MERSVDQPDEDGPASDAAERVAALRRRLGSERPAGAVLSFGIPDLDGRLPGGGLGLGRPHEIAPAADGDETAALGFTLALVAHHLARGAGDALLVAAAGHPLPYGHGLVRLGLDPGRLLFLEAGRDTEVFAALEEALRAGSLRAVAGFLADGLPLKPGRRLQLAGEAGAGREPPPLILLLRSCRADEPNGAATRWRVASGAATRDRFGSALNPCWRTHLDRCRNGRTGDWLLEWDHAAHRFGLPDGVAGHAPAARGRSA